MRIAVVGSGIAGLGAAYALQRRHDVTVYEKDFRAGGHSHTVNVPFGSDQIPVDTGFIVYNQTNYPLLTRLFQHLQVATQPSTMSFAVSIDGGRLEYAGTNALTLFAQRRNLARPTFLRMLWDIQRFNRAATAFVTSGESDMHLGGYLDRNGYGSTFQRHYLLPMAAAIWSAPMAVVRGFSMRRFACFFANHGLLSINQRPAWRTVTGGSREYVRRLTAPFGHRLRLGTGVCGVRRLARGVEVTDVRGGVERYDHVVIAAHSDQALAMLDQPGERERAILAAIPYQPNRAVLHGDASVMPRRQRIWSSWNAVDHTAESDESRMSVVYWMNKLQDLPAEQNVFLSLNPRREPDPATVIAEFTYDHPLLDATAVAAQDRIREIQGEGGVWFCGAWTGNGFHEDGLRAGLAVAQSLGAALPWERPLAGSAAPGMPELAAAEPA